VPCHAAGHLLLKAVSLLPVKGAPRRRPGRRARCRWQPASAARRARAAARPALALPATQAGSGTFNGRLAPAQARHRLSERGRTRRRRSALSGPMPVTVTPVAAAHAQATESPARGAARGGRLPGRVRVGRGNHDHDASAINSKSVLVRRASGRPPPCPLLRLGVLRVGPGVGLFKCHPLSGARPSATGTKRPSAAPSLSAPGASANRRALSLPLDSDSEAQ
jgi:hypothetical protein